MLRVRTDVWARVSFAAEQVGKRNLLMALSSATHIFGSKGFGGAGSWCSGSLLGVGSSGVGVGSWLSSSVGSFGVGSWFSGVGVGSWFSSVAGLFGESMRMGDTGGDVS